MQWTNWITLLRLFLVKFTKRERQGTAEESRGKSKPPRERGDKRHKGAGHKNWKETSRQMEKNSQNDTREWETHTERETGRVSLITREEGLPRWHISLIKRSCLGESFNRAVVIQPNRHGSVLIFISLTASLIYSDVHRGRVEQDRTANCLLFKSAVESVTVCVHECMQKVCVSVCVCVPFPEVDCLQLVGHLFLCDSSNPIKTQERLTGSGCQGNLC